MNNPKSTTLIVGAACSFGETIARTLSGEGQQLILACSGRQPYQIPAGIKGLVLQFDVTDSRAIAQAFTGCALPINNVVYSVSAPVIFKRFKDETWPDYEEQWQMQVRGLWQIVQLLRAHNQPLKRVVAIGSAVTLAKPLARLSAYTTAKYALLGLIKSLAVELAPEGVRVNMVSPNATSTGLSKDWPSLLLRAGAMTNPETVALVVESLLRNEDNRTGENILV